MPLHAIDDLDDALAATRAFLTPVEAATWAKLALVVLFVGGAGANVNPFQFAFGGPADAGELPAEVPTVDVDPGLWVLIAGLVAVGLGLVLAFVLVGSIMEFVLVESLRTREVTLRRHWGRRWRQGLRLFGFRLALGLVGLGAAALLLAPVVAPLVGFGPVGAVWVLALLAVVALFFVLGVAVGVVYGFTTVFVVPIMILEDCGVLAGWRRLWPTLVRDPKQYLVYAVTGLGLLLFGGFLVGVVTALGALVLLLPFGVLFAIAGSLFLFGSELLGIAALVVVGIAYALAIVAVAAVAQVPVQAYLRYHALLVLGDVEPSLDLIPDQREAARESSSAS